MKRTFSVGQCIALLEVVSARGTKRTRLLDRAFITAVLLSGGGARHWTWRYLIENFSDMPYAVFDAIRVLASSRKILIAPLNYTEFYKRNWVNGLVADHPIFSVSTTPLTTQEVTRRTKRYGRLAGISDDSLNLRTLSNTHQALMRRFGDEEAVARALGLPTIWDSPSHEQTLNTTSKPVARDPRLHGIGRRGGNLVTSRR